MKKRTTHLPLLILIFLTTIGAFLHFYNLNWGAPFYFHPDERNIASSISQLAFPQQLNPKFFAYGSLPIYTIFFLGLTFNFLTRCEFILPSCTVSFEQAIIISRIFSAFFATLLIPITYILVKKLFHTNAGLLTAFLMTFSVGMIQFSHFGTFELWTTFFAVCQLSFAIAYFTKGTKSAFYLLCLFTGILVSIKASNAVLLLVPILSVIVRAWFPDKEKNRLSLVRQLFLLFFLLVYTVGIYLLTNPFSFLDTEALVGSLRYESEVALGSLQVFYTGEFFNTTPLLFHLVKVFPFLLNPVVLIGAVISVFYSFFVVLTEKNKKLLFILVSLGVLFFSQAFFFVKWIRYMLPTLPFLSILIAFTYTRIAKKHTKTRFFLSSLVLFLLVTSSIVFSLSYFVTVYVRPDTRILARDFAVQSIPSDARILSEVYDLGITPFNDYFHRITLFNFYDLDSQGDEVRMLLEEELSQTDYIILPSQRILATRKSHPDIFPNGYAFYSELENNKERFTKIYETPCDIFCQITYLFDPIMRFEGTSNVFDRPHVIMYKVNE